MLVSFFVKKNIKCHSILKGKKKQPVFGTELCRPLACPLWDHQESAKWNSWKPCSPWIIDASIEEWVEWHLALSNFPWRDLWDFCFILSTQIPHKDQLPGNSAGDGEWVKTWPELKGCFKVTSNYREKNMVHVGHTSPMDPMEMEICEVSKRDFPSWSVFGNASAVCRIWVSWINKHIRKLTAGYPKWWFPTPFKYDHF